MFDPETKELLFDMENCLPAADVDDIEAMLREQLRACHESTKACFA